MITIVVGTRPEIIKMSPVIRACQDQEIEYSVLHTGQHYSYAMDRIFFEELMLPAPRHNLDAGSGSHGKQTGAIMAGVEEFLEREGSDLLLVQGDTNTVMAGAIAAAKLHVPVGHVEAGLRSFDRRMPEEVNRVVADHVSDYLFAPTKVSRDNLLAEGIPCERIYVTGNTVADAVFQNMRIAARKQGVLGELGVQPGGYFLVTAHRAENVDDPVRLRGLLSGLSRLHREYRVPVLFPMHPRTRKMTGELGLEPEGVIVTEPVGYLEFLVLESQARLVLTDSGGLQEEACILKVPCVTLRDNTERPETVFVGGNVLAGCSPERIVASAALMLSRERAWQNPYGDGNAGARIIAACRNVIR